MNRLQPCLVAVLLFLAATSSADDLNYKLTLGTELSYRWKQSLNSDNVSGETETQLSVVSVQATRKGMFRVVVFRTTGEDSRLELLHLSADGRVCIAGLEQASLLSSIFPPLSGGTRSFERQLTQFEVTQRAPGKFSVRVSGPYHRAFDVDERVAIEWGDGVVERAQSVKTQKRGFEHTTITEIVLQRVRRQPNSWVRNLSAECADYIETLSRYEQILFEERDVHPKADWPERAKALLTRLRSVVEMGPVVKCVETLLRRHPERVSSARTAAAMDANLRGAAVEWTVKDLQGKPHSIKKYRGKCVVLDFWFRECGFCLPTISRLKEFENVQGVVLLSVCKDNLSADAEVIANAMRIESPVLHGPQLARAYRVRACPAIVVIGPKGKVVDARVGYSPVVARWLRRSIARYR